MAFPQSRENRSISLEDEASTPNNKDVALEKAQATLLKTVEWDERPWIAHFQYAFLLDMRHEIEAMDQLELAYERGQTHAVAHYLAILHFRIGSAEGALKYFALAVESAGSCPTVHSHAASNAFLHGQKVEALQLSAIAISRSSRDASAWGILRYSLTSLGYRDLIPNLGRFAYELRFGTGKDDAEVEDMIALASSRLHQQFGINLYGEPPTQK